MMRLIKRFLAIFFSVVFVLNLMPIESVCAGAEGTVGDWLAQEYGSQGYENITEIVLPEGLKTIENGAFANCSNLVSIHIPKSVSEIEDDLTCYKNLKAIHVDEDNENYASVNGILYSKDGDYITLILCPRGYEGIAEVSASVDNIYADAFSYCEKLTAIEVADGNENYHSVDGVLYQDFLGKIRLVQCPGGYEGELRLPKDLSLVLEYAFAGCNKLTSIQSDENSICYVSENGILYNRNFQSVRYCPIGYTGEVVLSSRWTYSISDKSFADRSGITSVIIPEGAASIGSKAFANCINLKSITIPKSVGFMLYKDSFEGCEQLVISCYADSVAHQYAVENEIAYRLLDAPGDIIVLGNYEFAKSTDDTIEILGYQGSEAKVKIPEELNGGIVTSIGVQAFSECTALTSIEIPQTVTKIAENAFEGCENLVIKCKEGSAAETYAKANNIPYELIADVMLGDVNTDGIIDAADALLVLQHAANIIILEDTTAADVNQDSIINASDALLILQFAANIIDGFAI